MIIYSTNSQQVNVQVNINLAQSINISTRSSGETHEINQIPHRAQANNENRNIDESYVGVLNDPFVSSSMTFISFSRSEFFNFNSLKKNITKHLLLDNWSYVYDAGT